MKEHIFIIFIQMQFKSIYFPFINYINYWRARHAHEWQFPLCRSIPSPQVAPHFCLALFSVLDYCICFLNWEQPVLPASYQDHVSKVNVRPALWNCLASLHFFFGAEPEVKRVQGKPLKLWGTFRCYTFEDSFSFLYIVSSQTPSQQMPLWSQLD